MWPSLGFKPFSTKKQHGFVYMMILDNHLNNSLSFSSCVPSHHHWHKSTVAFWNLISNHLESNRRLVADCLGVTIFKPPPLGCQKKKKKLNVPSERKSYHFTDPYSTVSWIACQEFLWQWGWYNPPPLGLLTLCKSVSIALTIADQQSCIFQDWCCIENLWPTKNCSAIIKNAFADHRKTTRKRVVVGGRREVRRCSVQPVTDHRQTFCRPPTTLRGNVK